MNICFIAPQVMNAVRGGVSIQATNTAKALIDKGVTVTFYDCWKQYNWQDFDCVHIFRADLDTYNIANWLTEESIPFVVSPIFYSLHKSSKIQFALKLSQLARYFLKGIRSDFDCIRDICNKSVMALPNTKAEKEALHKGFGIKRDKLTVVPNAVESHFKDADPTLFEKKYGRKDFILSVGNFGYPRKNMLNLIKALKDLTHPAVLIGRIYENAYGRACQEQMQKAKNILWLDALDHKDPLLASAYAACKVFAMPSLYETPGLAALEAGLAGATIVITPNGGPREYFKDLAIYIDPKDVDSIKDGLTRATKSEPNPNLKEQLLQNYIYPKIADQLIQLYSDVTKR